MAGPMEGIRVVELAFWVAGPSAAGILADWGADVVKIEPPNGDPFRGLFLSAAGLEVPANPPFELDNRGKRSIALDFTKETGREIALRLIDRADVFVTNLRPVVLARLGLDPDSLAARNPRLVYAGITGYGRWFWLLGLQGNRHWPDLVRAVGRPEWLDDPRFTGMRARRENCAELVRLLDEIFATRPLAEWGEVFDREGVWWAPVQTTEDVVADPQAEAAGAWVEVPRPDAGTVRMLASPVDFSGTSAQPRGVAPELGQHTEEILLELGYDWEAIGALKEKGAIP